MTRKPHVEKKTNNQRFSTFPNGGSSTPRGCGTRQLGSCDFLCFEVHHLPPQRNAKNSTAAEKYKSHNTRVFIPPLGTQNHNTRASHNSQWCRSLLQRGRGAGNFTPTTPGTRIVQNRETLTMAFSTYTRATPAGTRIIQPTPV